MVSSLATHGLQLSTSSITKTQLVPKTAYWCQWAAVNLAVAAAKQLATSVNCVYSACPSSISQFQTWPV